MKKIFSFIIIMISCLFIVEVQGTTIEYAKNAKSACLIESSTNEVLYSKESDFRLAPASMTKIMTLTLIYEAMAINNASKADIVVASENACSFGGSQVYLEVNEQMTIDEMLKCICIASANDCAVAMAEHFYGSEAEFVNKMNEKATSLGLKNTHFMDCSGLTTKNHYSSAYDMAIMGDYLVTTYPDVLNYTNIREDYIRKDTDSPFWLVNTNKLIGKVIGVDGIKTGWTSEAGYCITLSMAKNGMRLISVVMGYSDPTVRNSEALELLNYGFANYSLEKLYEKGLVIITIESILYEPEKIEILLDEDVYVLKKKGEALKEYSYTIIEEPALNNNSFGKIEIFYDNSSYLVLDLKSKTEIKKRNFFEVVLELFRESFA